MAQSAISQNSATRHRFQERAHNVQHIGFEARWPNDSFMFPKRIATSTLPNVKVKKQQKEMKKEKATANSCPPRHILRPGPMSSPQLSAMPGAASSCAGPSAAQPSSLVYSYLFVACPTGRLPGKGRKEPLRPGAGPRLRVNKHSKPTASASAVAIAQRTATGEPAVRSQSQEALKAT